MITGCFFAIVCALSLVAIIAAYRHISELEHALWKLADRNRNYNKLIARYEIAIQSMPEEYRQLALKRIYEQMKEENQNAE